MVNLALGTVQFGLDYGVANKQGKPTSEQAREIIDLALKNGIQWLDTARDYGDAEKVVGECLSQIEGTRADKACVVTKFPSLKGLSTADIDAWLKVSLRDLKRERLEGLMLHDASDLTDCDTLVLDHFFNFCDTEEVVQTGVSVYTVEQAKHALGYEKLGVLQVPSNLFDRSFIEAGIFEECKARGVTVFVRSIFLQGLFFLDPDDQKVKGIDSATSALTELQTFCKDHECSIAELCFADATRFEGASILVGVENISQLKQNLESLANSTRLISKLAEWDVRRPKVSQQFRNPSLWNIK